MVQPSGDVLEVLVVDDHRTFADAISLAIDVEPDLHCCGTYATAEDAIAAVQEDDSPAVVLLDLILPGMSGIDAIAPLREASPDIRVIALTSSTSATTLIAAVDAGANGFLPKEQPFADVLEAIRSDDSLTLDAVTMVDVLRAAASGEATTGADVAKPELTDREYSVLLLLAEAQSVKTIAHDLGITVHTCRGHVRSILAKTGAHSQLAAVLCAARAGMLPHMQITDG